MPRFIDAHTHVQFAAYKNDYQLVIERALANNIWLVNIGTQKDTSASAVKIAKALNNAYILDEFHDTLIDKLYKELVERGKIKET